MTSTADGTREAPHVESPARRGAVWRVLWRRYGVVMVLSALGALPAALTSCVAIITRSDVWIGVALFMCVVSIFLVLAPIAIRRQVTTWWRGVLDEAANGGSP